MTGVAAQRVVHPALDPVAGEPVGRAPLTDRQRIAVALQAAALLSLLRQAAWRPSRGWRGARVDRAGRLGGVAVAPGRDPARAADRLGELLTAAFGERDSVPGRGQARAAARRLLAVWRAPAPEAGPDRAVAEILREAPFLWLERFAGARGALVGELERDGDRALWIAGPPAFRGRLLAAAADRRRLDSLLAAPEARRRWEVVAAGGGAPLPSLPRRASRPAGGARGSRAADVRESAATGRPRVGPPPADDGIVGRSAGLLGALDRLERLARRELPVLIQGETGTGKELAARRLHRLSPRRRRPFVAVNCGALTESLLASELFGHARGAFTGADRERLGIFETAAAGTVLLDEIGDLPLAAQANLLRVLQEGEVRRVGESRSRTVDVRVVAASHRNLAAMVADGAFRRDLFYRLRVGTVELPPLREREGDVLLLARHFLREHGCRLEPAARHRLLAHHWPGNVRELRNVLEVAVAFSEDGLVRCRHLDLQGGMPAPRAAGYHRQVEELRRRLVREALTATGGNRAAAARRLGLSRQALSYLARRLEIG